MCSIVQELKDLVNQVGGGGCAPCSSNIIGDLKDLVNQIGGGGGCAPSCKNPCSSCGPCCIPMTKPYVQSCPRWCPVNCAGCCGPQPQVQRTLRFIGGVEPYSNEGFLNGNVSSYPYFEFNVPRNVTTAVGQTAFLHCRVEQLGDKAVSWIRKRDLHILTAGILTYTSDQRFQVIRPDKSDNWTLQIKFPQLRDSGVYECQVNTEPKMSLPFRLNVIEAKARILEASDLHVKAGSSVTLTCVINQGPHDLGTVFWYKGDEIVQTTQPHVNDADSSSRVTVQNQWTDGLTSRLHITSAHLSDSGNYSCVPTIAAPTSVNVHVINGEHPAAMQHGNKNTAPLSLSLHCTLVYSISVFIIKHIR